MVQYTSEIERWGSQLQDLLAGDNVRTFDSEDSEDTIR